MAVTKLTMSGFKPSTYNKYDDFLAGNAAYDPAATWLIQRVNGTGSAGTITFSSIPSTYTSLQIRAFFRPSINDALYVRVNGLSTSVYAYHTLSGSGTATFATGYATQTEMFFANYTYPTSVYGQALILDVHDYANTSRNKTFRCFTGNDQNGAGAVDLISGLFNSTAAITSLSFTLVGGGNFDTSSTFALYGMKG